MINDTIVIAGSDKRGTIYGIYDLSEKIGVSPWCFWADTVIGHADCPFAMQKDEVRSKTIIRTVMPP